MAAKEITMAKYTVYFYDLDQLWYVFDNETCSLVGSGFKTETEAKEKAAKYNSYA